MTVPQTAIGLLRQQLREGTRVHGIITHGGEAPNVIPDDVRGNWFVRTPDLASLQEAVERIQRCFEAGALASGAELLLTEPMDRYSEFLPDPDLVALASSNARLLNRPTSPPSPGATRGDLMQMAGSTDMADLSLVMPTIHPLIGIDAGGAVNHQAEFAAACVGESASRAIRDGALLMAYTAIDAATSRSVRERLVARQSSTVTQDRTSSGLTS